MNELSNPLSYKFIQNSIKNFRGLRKDDFNLYDEPGTYWFKPVFYFYRSDVNGTDSDINNEGLLHPSWESGSIGDLLQGGAGDITAADRKSIINQGFVSSAYNYLLRNDEEIRAKLLRQFITLLSNIASRSPWYFQEVTGLDNAIDHSEAFKNGTFVTEDRRQITFTLLPDAIDDRIGTLLDLYRTVCYDWRNKREILPANLRKFDMGLYIHGSMIQNDDSNMLISRSALSGALKVANEAGIGYDPKTEFVNAAGKYEYEDYQYDTGEKQKISSVLGETPSGKQIINTREEPIFGTAYRPKGSSHVYLEFINCEIDLSSTKIGDTISNAEGSEVKYTLTITYDDCYVNRYNDFIIGAIGDVLRDDLKDIYGQSNNVELGRTTHEGLSKIVHNAVSEVKSASLGTALQTVQNYVGSALIGNLGGVSATGIIRDIASGRFVGPASQATNALIQSQFKQNTIEPGKKLYETLNTIIPQKRTKTLGNLYKGLSATRNL